jgi:hypothetical protein
VERDRFVFDLAAAAAPPAAGRGSGSRGEGAAFREGLGGVGEKGQRADRRAKRRIIGGRNAVPAADAADGGAAGGCGC